MLNNFFTIKKTRQNKQKIKIRYNSSSHNDTILKIEHKLFYNKKKTSARAAELMTQAGGRHTGKKF